MESLHIEFQPNVKEKLLEFLNSFSTNELKIVEEKVSENIENSTFEVHKKRLQKSLDDIKSGKNKTLSLDELDEYLEQTISKYEN